MTYVYDPVGADCLGHQPGTEALQNVLTTDHQVTDLGTYVCKYIIGSTRRSFHAEGRAGDNGGTPEEMRAVADLLVAHALELGLQEVIYDRQRWACDDSTPGWEPFNGSDPHTGHVHWSVNWDAAKNLTEDKVRRIFAPVTGEDDLLMGITEEQLRQIIAEEVDKAVAKRIGNVAEGAKQTVHEACRQAIRVTKPKA